MSKPQISIIVPVYNEEDNLKPLFNKIKSSLSKISQKWELIFVNDGSQDNSESILTGLSKEHSEIRLINLSRNFGQTAAFAAGIDNSQGEIIVTMDADLQNDPVDIPKMLEMLQEKKVDIVVGWRKNRKDPFLRSVMSKIANRIIKSSTNTQIHDTGCSLRIYKREVVQNLKLYGEMHRFIPALAVANGARIIEMEVNHFPRQHGQSKYGFMRTFKVLLDLLTVKFLSSFQTKPIYMFGFIGIFFILLSILIGIFVILRVILLGGILISPLFTIGVLLNIFGVVYILLGLLAEIQIRTWFESSGKKSYIVKSKSNDL
jgi:glycosyltransferase involved in cell wall biosynthesis